MIDNTLTYKVIGCIYNVYNALGPGLLESIYEKALMIELAESGLKAESQLPIAINYKGHNIGEGLRLDIIVENKLVLELKSVEELHPVHYKQLSTYLRILNTPVGLLINFNEKDIRNGIHRVLNGYES